MISDPVTIYGAPYTREFFEAWRAAKMYKGGDPRERMHKFYDLLDFAREIWRESSPEAEALFLWRLENFLREQTPSARAIDEKAGKIIADIEAKSALGEIE